MQKAIHKTRDKNPDRRLTAMYDKIAAGWLKKTGRNPTDRGKQGVKLV